jgi:glycosyltransferase involved in cell wall biosynthesis
MPLVSIVVRTKDRPGFLTRALADITAQTFDDWEIIVVNDGGDGDEVRARVDAHPSAERVQVIDTEAPGGRCAAANAGVRASRGEYLVLHDDDDLWHPEFLARTTAALGAHSMDAGVMVATEILYERPEGSGWVETQRTPYWHGMSAVSFTSLLEVNRAVPISFLYRRSLHDVLGPYDEALEAVEDWDFYLRVTARHPIAFLGGTPLAYWTQRPTVTGADGNSMFELASEHERDDRAVRDRALREWVAENGPGLPLYIASVEKRLRAELAAAIEQVPERVADAVYARHPVWRRLARLRRRRT